MGGEKKLSYNNLLDLDAAINIAYHSSSKENICTIVKHNIPCGGAIKKRQKDSYLKALAGDPLSAFGGIVAFNQKLTLETAKMLIIKIFMRLLQLLGLKKMLLNYYKQKKILEY